MDMKNAVVVGVDGRDDQAVLWAAAEARRRTARLVLAFAAGLEDQPSLWPPSTAHMKAQATAFGSNLLTGALATVSEAEPGVEVSTHLSMAPPAQVLLDASREAQLIVVGTRQHPRSVNAVLGSVSERVAGRADCPVAVVKYRKGAVLAPTLVAAVKGGPDGEDVLRYACEEARIRGADVVAVHGLGTGDLIASYGLGYFSSVASEVGQSARAELDTLVARIEADYPEVSIRCRVLEGGAAHAVEEAARQADLVVIGARRHPDWAAHLGRAAAAIIHHAPCPTILLPRDPARRVFRPIAPDAVPHADAQ